MRVKRLLKRCVKWVWSPLKVLVAKVIARLIYDPTYLKGRHFSGTNQGWFWVAECFVWQTLFGINRGVPWPVSPRILIGDWRNIVFDADDLQNFQSSGGYYQGLDAKIIIGKGTWIAPNVGLITANHDPTDPEKHVPGEDIVLGECCWIGMNAVLLPGTVLGPHTVVGAGAVVTRSFPEGYCVVAGNPAKKIRSLNETA